MVISDIQIYPKTWEDSCSFMFSERVKVSFWADAVLLSAEGRFSSHYKMCAKETPPVAVVYEASSGKGCLVAVTLT